VLSVNATLCETTRADVSDVTFCNLHHLVPRLGRHVSWRGRLSIYLSTLLNQHFFPWPLTMIFLFGTK
jgi:hypothetical protein